MDASNLKRPVTPWRIGVDVGGTFTDLVLVDATGQTWVAKLPSVPSDPSQGVHAALAHVAIELGMTAADVLAGCALFIHGSTVATNTMLEGKGAKVGLITTEGFRDTLEIRRGLREDQWNHRAPYAPVLVPRYLRAGIGGRIDADGEEFAPLDLAAIDDTLATFASHGVEAVAVALLNSFVNASHEHAVEQAVRERAEFEWVTCSSDVSALMGEYERTATAVVNAALSPRIVAYLQALEADLAAGGLAKGLLLVQSNGGAASVSQLSAKPVNLLLSGPAAAVGALNLYSKVVDAAATERPLLAAADHVAGTQNLISMEIGGTSCDVLLMAGGEVEVRDDISVAGYHVSTPAIDIHTIGAGGGTIAGVDDAGLLFVGPQGAGAEPGPACYGRGGELPTVTDAQLVLGRLRPGKSISGTLDLDIDAARRSIATHIAEPLGVSVTEAAAGVIELIEAHLLSATEHISIERGHSPRNFTLTAAGGAGPMHGAAVAEGLGCGRVYVPRDAGALCAIGMLHTDVRRDTAKFLMGSIDELDPASIVAGFDELRADAHAELGKEGFSAKDVSIVSELELHHPGQLWTIRVEVPNEGREVDRAAVRASFEAEYERLYGHIQPDGVIMVASLRVTASGAVGEAALAQMPRSTDAAEPTEWRDVYFTGHGLVPCAIYDGQQLSHGHEIAGPAVVEETTTTVVVRPGDVLWVDRHGEFFIDVAQQAAPGELAESNSAGTQLDPVVLAVMQNRLDQISRHMGWVMTRTARSTIFSQSHDFSCYVTTGDGTLVANADGIPIHTGGGGFAVRALLARFEGRIEPEDVFLLSDPYVAGGNHLPDWVIARPIFVPADGADAASGDGELVLAGFCCNRAHQSDIGGGLAGTYNPEATEIWHEGIRLPVLKLIERGEVRDDLWELLLINCRTPELLDGDLRAMIGSTRIGGERIAALAAELGSDRYADYLAGVLDHGDRRMRAAIAELPDGTYVGEDRTDNDCFGPADIAVRATVTVNGNEMAIDFTGSDAQIEGFKNSSLANTYSSAYLAVSSFFDTSIPRNEGTYRAVTITAPEGSIVNALPPAPMTMNTVFVAHEIVTAVWRALAHAAPDRACAGWSKTMHGHVTGRRADGSTWVMYQWHAMGTPGATAERDGFAQMGHLITLGGLDLPNLEFHEQHYPVRYVRHEQRCDAAGPGLRRGGTGVIYEADITQPATWSFRAEGLDTPSGHGTNGGGTGTVGLEWITPVDVSIDSAADGERFVPPKYGVRKLGPARMIAHTPGGGGWGDAFERPADAVLRDVMDEVVSVEAAARDYGVVIAHDPSVPGGYVVDEAATDAARAGEREPVRGQL